MLRTPPRIWHCVPRNIHTPYRVLRTPNISVKKFLLYLLMKNDLLYSTHCGHRRQTCHAVCFAYLSSSSPQGRQPWLLRVTAVVILFHIIFVLSFYAIVSLLSYFNCDNALVATTGTCKGLVTLKSFITDNIDKVITIIIGEVMAGMGAFAFVLTGWLKLWNIRC